MFGIIARILKIVAFSSVFWGVNVSGFASTDLRQTIENSGLLGSFLASRIALSEQDDHAAVEFLARAHDMDPENQKLKQDLLVALVSNGKVAEAEKLLRGMEVALPSENLVGFIQAATLLKKRSWKKVPDALKNVDGSVLGKTMREIILAWALAGERKVDEALERIETLEGPEWVKVTRDYHAGLIAEISGRNALAAARFQSVIDNKAVLSESYIRVLEALIRNRSKSGETQHALDALEYGQTLVPRYGPFVHLREQINNGEVLKPIISSSRAGVAELYYNIATALRRDGASAFAKTYLQIGNYLQPENDVITIALAELYLSQGDYKRSSEYYDAVKETSPFYRISRIEMAINLSRLEQIDDAIVQLRQLMELEPDDLLGYMALGGIFSQEKRYREAADLYDKAVAIINTPENHHWNLFFRRGIAYERLKKWEKAEPDFKKSLELSPDQPEVLNYLGYSWVDQGINLDEGMDLIRKAVDLRPRSGFIIDSLGWAYYRLGQYENAVRELERAVALMPVDPTINDHLGDAYWKVGRRLEATFQWKIALASKTEPENHLVIRAKLREGLKDNDNDAGEAKGQ